MEKWLFSLVIMIYLRWRVSDGNSGRGLGAIGRETYKVVWKTVALPPESSCHFGESLGLDEVVEGERGEHGSVPVNGSLDHQSGSTYTVELHDLAGISLW